MSLSFLQICKRQPSFSNFAFEVFQKELCCIYRIKLDHDWVKVYVKLAHFMPLLMSLNILIWSVEDSYFPRKITSGDKTWNYFCSVKDIKLPEKSEQVLLSFVFRSYDCKLYNNVELISYQLLVSMGS